MTITHWKESLTLRDFEIINTLGSGGFGTCSKAKYNDVKVCIKQIDRISKRKAALQSFKAETKEEFFKFDHVNIVKLFAASEIIDDLLMVFELIEGEDLQSIINDKTIILGLERMTKYGYEIASALGYTHSFQIAHLDLKPANVLVTKDDVCKLADFGCSEYIERNPAVKRVKSLLTGTYAYRAPELLKGGHPTEKSDIYSLGISLWQMWNRSFPYSGVQQHAVIFQVVSKNRRPVFDENMQIHSEYKDLCVRCWSAKPEMRPSVDDVMVILKSIKE